MIPSTMPGMGAFPVCPNFRSVLILGGTAEAYRLANLAAQIPTLAVTTALAGRTESPLVPLGALRIGGFGGISGLQDYLTSHQIQRVVDATHPFAIAISQQVAIATAQLQIPLLRLVRPAWQQQCGDNWISVSNLVEAAQQLPGLAERVFLSIGRQDLAPFCELPDLWFLMRMVDAPRPDQVLPRGQIICQRGPFLLTEEQELLESHQIQAIVSKNSGGTATYAKIAAARALGIPVIMVQRPVVAPLAPDLTTVDMEHDPSITRVIDWILSESGV